MNSSVSGENRSWEARTLEELNEIPYRQTTDSAQFSLNKGSYLLPSHMIFFLIYLFFILPFFIRVNPYMTVLLHIVSQCARHLLSEADLFFRRL